MTPLLLAAALALGSPDDTPIEPIDSAVIENGIALGLLEGSCTATAALADAAGNLAVISGDLTIASLLTDAGIAYFIDVFEDEWDPAASLTMEAEELLTEYLDDCAAGLR